MNVSRVQPVLRPLAACLTRSELASPACVVRAAKTTNAVDQIKAEAKAEPVITHRLRGNVSVIEGSGGNIGVLAGKQRRSWSTPALPCPSPEFPTPSRA